MATNIEAHRPRPVDVSVIVPSIRPDRVWEALSSVASQHWPGSLEAIVVHDGGPPWRLGPWSFPVRSLGSRRALGPGAARNRAAAQATGSILAFLDDDDVWLPNHLALTVPAFAERGGLVFTDALVEHLDEGWVAPLGLRYEQRLLTRTNPAILSSLILAREAFERLSGFSEDLPRYEDWDLLLRAERLGLPIHQVWEPTIRYRFSTKSTSADLGLMAETFQAFTARHQLTDLPVTNFARIARCNLAAESRNVR